MAFQRARYLKRLLACTAMTTAASCAALGFFGSAASAQDGDEATEVITVRGQFIPNEKRETSEISSLVNEEDFQIQGDSDVAASLRRVTGLSLSTDSKYIFARGLNERYSNATLNGSPLPSPEPLRRTVPLDIFPTSVLASALAQKTFAPENSAEFGGAVIDLRTRTVPSERFFEASASVGGNDTTFMKDALLYDGGGDEDYTGWDNGTRNYPDLLAATFGVTRLNDLQASEREAIAADVADPALWVMQSGDAPGSMGFSGTAGDRFDISPNLSIGVLATAAYSSDWVTRSGSRRENPLSVSCDRDDPTICNPLGTIPDVNFERFSTQQNIQSSGLAQVGIDLLDNHELKFLVLGVRNTEKEARQLIGSTSEEPVRLDYLEWFERQVWTAQAHGEHYFPAISDLAVEWRASYSEGLRDAPFQIAENYTLNPTLGYVLNENQDQNLQFSVVTDTSDDVGVDLSLPFVFAGMDIELKGGFASTGKERQAVIREYHFAVTGVEEVQKRIDIALRNIRGNNVTELGGFASPDFYSATLDVDAVYFGADAQVTPNLRFALGARYEDAAETVLTQPLVGPDPEAEEAEYIVGRDNCYGQGTRFVCSIEKDPVSPAATLTWTFADDLQMRVGYSQTLVRPEFRELAPTIFTNTETDVLFTGNPFLRNTQINNYDARLEYYFGRDQYVTGGVFYKDIDGPIEESLQEVGGGVYQTTFINSPSAELFGGEVEFEKVFAVPSRWEDMAFLSSKDFFVGANYTYSKSEVSADGVVVVNGSQLSEIPSPLAVDAAGIIVDGRPLQGQSEHLFNVQVGWNDYDSQSRLAVLLNYASERIRSAEYLQPGSLAPAIYEEPPTSLDVTYSRVFDVAGSEIELGLKAQNLLGDDYEAYQKIDGSDAPFDTYEIGRAYSISLTARY